MKKQIFAFAIVLGSTATAFAQPYLTAVGVRLFGVNGTGVSLQQRLNDGYALEGMYQATKERYTASALFKVHEPILFTRHWNYYFGLGGHYGGYNKQLDALRVPAAHFYGVNGMIGSELTIGRFNIGLDYMPAYRLNKPESEDLLTHDFSISLRIVLIKAKKAQNIFEKLGKIFEEEGATKKKKDKDRDTHEL